MLVYNLCTLGKYILLIVLENELIAENNAWIGTKYVVLGVLQWFFIVIAYLAFNVGNAYFGLHYFKCQSEMRVMSNQVLSYEEQVERLENVRKRNTIITWFVMILNIGVVLAFTTLSAY